MTCIKITFKHIKNNKKSCKEYIITFKVNKNNLIYKKIKFYLNNV